MTAKRDLVRWAWDRVPALGLSASELHVLRALVQAYDERTQRTTRSLVELASITALSETTVLRALRTLEDRNLLRRESRVDANGGKASNAYTFGPQASLARSYSAGSGGNTPPSGVGEGRPVNVREIAEHTPRGLSAAGVSPLRRRTAGAR